MLSLCMVVRDEEAALPRCLASVDGVVDEVVVVDTGSVDGTEGIVRAAGGVVLPFDFRRVDFAAARNAGLARAAGDWALVLDADEALDPGSRELVRALATGGGDVGYVLTRRNLAPDGTPARTDHAVRLFPSRFRYRHRVHETVDESVLAAGGRLVVSDVVIDHALPAPDVERAKGERYLALLLESMAEEPEDADRLVFLAAEYHKLGRYAEATAVTERVAALRPDDPAAHLNAALYHAVFGGDPARARADLAAVLRLRPRDPEALALLAELDAR